MYFLHDIMSTQNWLLPSLLYLVYYSLTYDYGYFKRSDFCSSVESMTRNLVPGENNFGVE